MSFESAKSSLKRQRTEKCYISEREPIIRSEYWFDDGNVILQAENLQFRVHRSIFSRHSVVLKELLLGTSQLESTGQGLLIEGCPVVHLHDSSEDVEIVVSIFYDHVE